MTTARTVAPNHGGRANTRGRAVVASFNAADARSSVPVPQDSGREVDSPVSVVQRSAWNCAPVIPSRINARPAAPINAVSNVQRILHGRGWQPIHAGRCGCDTYTWRAIPDRQSAYWTQKHLPARVVGMTAPIHPALRAPGFRPTDAGVF